jgi:predicted GNAT family N-acyltransferase
VTAAAPPVRVEQVDVDVVRPLRAAVLRAGRPWRESVYPQDDLATTVHLAAYDPAGLLVGCSTWFADPWEHVPVPAALTWRLRGMASAPEARGTGAGGALLVRGFAVAAAAGADLLWCQARTTARGFYAHYGMREQGGEFLAAHGVEHVEMWTPLPYLSLEP